MSKIPKGYKQTEVGIIPEAWECLTIKELIEKNIIQKPLDGNHGNIHPKSTDFVDSGIPFIMANDVRNGKIGLNKCHYIKKEQADKLQKGFSITGDVLLTHKGTVGNVAIVGLISTEYIMLTPQVTYYRVINADKLLNLYIKHYFECNEFQSSLANIAGGGTRAYIGIINQQNLFFVLPPINEQYAIAEALSDFDALISSLDELIAKKRNIKQGAMQELLTGKRRLPGFSGKIECQKIGEVVEIVSGGTPRTNIDHYWKGEIKWCTPTDITACHGKYLKNTERTISSDGLANCSAKLLPKGSILLCSRATIGELKIASIETSTNQGFKSLICKNEIKNEYLYYVLLTQKSKMIEKAIGSTFLEISKKEVASLYIWLPSLEEQSAIASVLSDMDAEIEQLERKRDKYKQAKQGMMQELLTGKIRLIKD